MHVSKDDNKQKRVRRWPFLKNKIFWSISICTNSNVYYLDCKGCPPPRPCYCCFFIERLNGLQYSATTFPERNQFKAWLVCLTFIVWPANHFCLSCLFHRFLVARMKWVQKIHCNRWECTSITYKRHNKYETILISLNGGSNSMNMV